jgi:hypothetical protein
VQQDVHAFGRYLEIEPQQVRSPPGSENQQDVCTKDKKKISIENPWPHAEAVPLETIIGFESALPFLLMRSMGISYKTNRALVNPHIQRPPFFPLSGLFCRSGVKDNQVTPTALTNGCV